MKLLFDQNISPHLTLKLKDLFLGSAHVRDFDFHQRSFLYGPPPKVIWIQRGNCSTQDIETIFRQHHQDIRRFDNDPVASFLILV